MDLSLYLHFPFCFRKCRYCDFLSFPADEETKKIYAAAMIREIRGYAETAEGCHVTTVFLGGGTPSVMPARMLREIFKALYESFDIAPDAEITMEMNPGTVNEANLSFVFDHINRVSLGVQSVHEDELDYLGRIHSFADAVRSYELLRANHVGNINIDLMSGIPLQSAESWEETLRTVTELGPEHISAYSLIVEEGTEFYRLRKNGRLQLPDEETERRMYARTKEILGNAGYERYEISNYAREGYRCRHNLRTWRRGDYIGFGIGAASLFQHTRWRNTRNLEHYFENSADPQRIVREMENLDLRSEVEEFLFLGLRTMDGVSEQTFRDAFQLELRDIYGDVIDRQVSAGFLTYENGVCALTERGIDVSNRVLAEFLLD